MPDTVIVFDSKITIYTYIEGSVDWEHELQMLSVEQGI